MADQTDGIDEALEATLRVALTVAGRVAERIARERQQQLRDAQAVSEREARELQSRLDAERQAARAALAPVEREEWWQRAQPQQIADAWETANVWKDVDPDARRAADRIEHEVRGRHGLDVRELGADPAAVRAALEQRDQARDAASDERATAAGEEAEAAQILAAGGGLGDAEQQHAEQESEPPYDSAERRRELATALEGVADAEAVQARVLADVNQAQPAAEAVAARPGRGGKARPSRGRGPGQARRSERGR